MKTIHNDPNVQLSEKIASLSPSSQASQAKAREDARTTVLDESDRSPQWVQITPNISAPHTATNSRQPVKVSATSPAKGYSRHPDMPSTPSNASLNINY